MYRYRLVNPEGVELGTFVSPRAVFQVGEELGRSPDERFLIVGVVAAEQHEKFRAYLIVRSR